MPKTPTVAYQADRETDAQIAMRIFGYPVASELAWHTPYILLEDVLSAGTQLAPMKVPSYSTQICDAWAVVSHFAAAGYGMSLEHYGSLSDAEGRWWAWFVRHRSDTASYAGSSASAPTAPLAICRAALTLVGGD